MIVETGGRGFGAARRLRDPHGSENTPLGCPRFDSVGRSGTSLPPGGSEWLSEHPGARGESEYKCSIVLVETNREV